MVGKAFERAARIGVAGALAALVVGGGGYINPASAANLYKESQVEKTLPVRVYVTERTHAPGGMQIMGAAFVFTFPDPENPNYHCVKYAESISCVPNAAVPKPQ